MTNIGARTVFVALLAASVVLAVPDAPASAAAFQDGGYDPGPPPVPPVASSSSGGIGDECHVSATLPATQFYERTQNGQVTYWWPLGWTGVPEVPAPPSEVIRLRVSNAALGIQCTSRGAVAQTTGLYGEASLRFDPIAPELPPSCCHNVACNYVVTPQMMILREVGEGGYPASAEHVFGSPAEPNFHRGVFVANGCPPMGIGPVAVGCRKVWWLQVNWTKEDEESDYADASAGGQFEDRTVNVPTPPPVIFTPIPGAFWAGSGNGPITVTFWTALISRHIFCHYSILYWENDLRTTRAACSPNATAISRSTVDFSGRIWLHDYVAGEIFWPEMTVWGWDPYPMQP